MNTKRVFIGGVAIILAAGLGGCAQYDVYGTQDMASADNSPCVVVKGPVVVDAFHTKAGCMITDAGHYHVVSKNELRAMKGFGPLPEAPAR